MARVHRERVLLVGGQRALVMQLAHPLVAAAVAEHSDFPARALGRLRRTLDLSLATVFGTPEEAERAAAGIRAVHERVTGVSGGRPYRATDPRLLQWVNATLIDTTLVVYERFVRPLGEEERARYYEEVRRGSALVGIPEDVVPPDLPAFRRYLDEMLGGAELRATPDGRALVAAVLRPPLSPLLGLPAAVARRLTLALLPERVRALFGLRGGSPALLAAAARTSRAVLPFLPPAIREFSAARRGR